jgi:hypothetical protein
MKAVEVVLAAFLVFSNAVNAEAPGDADAAMAALSAFPSCAVCLSFCNLHGMDTF